MALEIITLREVSAPANNVVSVSMATDLKILSLLSSDYCLQMRCSTSKNCEHLNLSKIRAYAWEEDNSINEFYRLLCITTENELICYTVEYKSSKLCVVSSLKWLVEANLNNFLVSIKGTKSTVPTEILKYESKEAVIVFAQRFVVSFSLSSNGEPTISSFADVSENGSRTVQISMVKDTIFVLNDLGTQLSAYSVLTHSKEFEMNLMDLKGANENLKNVAGFVISLERDIIVFYTSCYNIYCMSLDHDWNFKDNYSKAKDYSMVHVTAFIKQFPSDQRIEQIVSHRSSVTGILRPVTLSCDTTNLKLDFIALYNGKLCFLFTNDEISVAGIQQLSVDASTAYKKFENRAFVVKGNYETFPLLLLHKSSLFLILYDIEHDKLVNELMMHHYSGYAESLSSINNWQNIQIDLEVLKQGLRNRQLDSVEFFLKTHEKRLEQLICFNSDESLSQECSMWDGMLDLVLETISLNICDKNSCHFANKLAQILMSFIIHVMKKLTEVTSLQEIAKDEISKVFCKHIIELRQIVYCDVSSLTKDVNEILPENSCQDNPELFAKWNEWKKYSVEEIIEEAILNNDIIMAQSYFWNHTDVSFTKYGDVDKFRSVALHLVSDSLKQGDLRKSINILENMGIPIDEKLSDIFINTQERDVRETLLLELRRRRLLKDEDEKNLNFALILQNLYPCTSFENARELQEEKCSHIEDWRRCAFPNSEMNEELVVGSTNEPSWNNCETGAYCNIVLRWISMWDDETKMKILASHFLHGSYVSNLEMASSSVWNYILEYGDSPLISKWISYWLDGLPMHSPEEFPYNWPLTETMINSVKELAPAHVAESALNEFARYGVFCEEELEDISVFLTRVGKSSCDLNNPSIFLSNKSTISFTDLCHRLVHYCLKHNLIHFLFQFLTRHSHRFISWPTCQLCNVSILRMIKAYCSWSRDNKDSRLAYNAMVATAEHIFNVPQLSSEKLLTRIPVPLNVAILLFGNVALENVIKNATSDLTGFQKALLSCPLLHDSLFQSDAKKLQPSISLYKLLQGNIPFDSSKLFGWQSANTIKNEDSQSQLPHFCSPRLSEQYGLKEPLSYFFYLMEGRPNFAYLKFIARELATENQISLTRVRQACRNVFNYAMSNFHDEKICAACVVFMEMLGHDSLPLRTCIINAKFLLEKLCLDDSDSHDAKDKVLLEISILFKTAFDDPKTAKKVVNLVETEITKKWISVNTGDILEDISIWMPVIALSNLLGLTAGETYLSICAENDKWLHFLVFAQIFQLPREQVFKCLCKFSNPCIGNHLEKALGKKNTPTVNLTTSKGDRYKERDLRKSLYNRIGLTKDDSKVIECGSPTTEFIDEDSISLCSVDTTTSSDPELGFVVIMDDLFSQLLYSHTTEVPWISLLRASIVLHYPALSLFAASYPDADLHFCFATWLSTISPKNKTSHDLESLQSIVSSWTEADLESLIVEAMAEKKILLLQLGISIFLPKSPLLALMEFIVEFLVYKKLDSSAENFKRFQNELCDYVDGDDECLLHSLRWIESISVVILKKSVLTCSSSYERNVFLRHLAFTRIEKSLKHAASVPSFSKVYQMLQYYTADANTVELFLLPTLNPGYTASCWKSVRQLIYDKMYNEARMFAKFAGLPAEDVHMLQFEQEAKNIKIEPEWSSLSHQITFWKKILATMKEHKLNIGSIIKFFKAQCDMAVRHGEKCIVAQFIIECYMQLIVNPDDSFEIYSLNADMWHWCMKEMQLGLSVSDIDALVSSKEYNFNQTDLQFEACKQMKTYNDQEKKAIENIIDHVLTKRNLNKALEVSKVFNFTCPSLKTIVLCLKIAKGEVEPYGVDIEEPSIIENISPRKKSVVSWTTSSKHGPSTSEMQIIHVLEKLCEQSTVATPICDRILVNYTVSAVLNCGYDEVSKEEDPFVILKKILCSSYKDKFSVAKSLITVHELNDDSVANFLCQIIHSSIASIPQSASMLPENFLATVEDNEIIYDPSEESKWFLLMTKLCQDSSLLGKKLIDLVSTYTLDADVSPTKHSFYKIVELCIIGHHCYTESCDVEGIAQVLHKSQKIITCLADKKEFQLLVRLFMGIGRYSEMSYVFDILQEHEYFELLFEKKMKTVPHLKLALLDYLKRCPSKNADNYYNMLALKFCMHREIAELLEMNARKTVLKLCKRKSDVGLQNDLEKAMEELADASESYCKAECYMQAQLCAHLAKLIALQLFLLSTGTWILGLDEMSVSRCITEMKEFSHALIVADAYKHNQSWSQAVFNNVIVNGNWNYLKELQNHFGLSETLFEDVAKEFQISQNKNETQLNNMRQLLAKCKNITIKYQLVMLLGFSDIAEELCIGDNGAYIQDLIATSAK